MSLLGPEQRNRALPIMLTQAVGLAAGLIGIRLTSQWVAPEDHGPYSLLVSLVPLGHGVVMAGALKALSREWATTQNRRGLLGEIACLGRRQWPWLAVGAMLAGLAVSPRQIIWLAPAIFVIAGLHIVIQMTQLTRQADRLHWQDFGLTVMMASLRSIAPPVLYLFTGWGLPALVSGFSLQSVVLTALCLWLLHADWRRSTDAGPVRISASYSGKLFVALASVSLLLQTSNRWIALHFFTPEVGGYFGLALNAAAIAPTILGTIALQYCQPDWFGREHHGREDRLKLLRSVDRVALTFAILAIGATLLLHALLPWLIGPLIAPLYAPTAEFVAPAGCFVVAFTTGYFFHAALLAARREKACGPADFWGAAVLVAGSVTAALVGKDAFRAWLVAAPVVPWLVNRSLARRALMRDE